MNQSVPPYFSEIKDPRVTGRCKHLLSDILMIGLCTYLTGGTDYQDMRMFALERGNSLKEVLQLPNGVPSEDTFERVFKRIDPYELQRCLQYHGGEILSDLTEKQLVIDGKKLKGASPTTQGNKGLYLMNAWVSENRICVAQHATEDKSNEIAAIPHVISSIDITGAIVSIDALGTKRDMASLIIERQGHYLLALKKNQPNLFEDVETAFRTHAGYDICQSTEVDHGRIETRKCSILPAEEFLEARHLQEWAGIKTIVKMESTRQHKNKLDEPPTTEIRYYISDEQEPTAAYFNALIRGHWSIENQLHWHLDVTFREDSCRTREGYAPQNLAILRKLALHVVSRQKIKLSTRKRIYKAALDNNYLRLLLMI